MADNTNTPKPEQIEALTRAEQILRDQLEKQLNIRFKSNEEFRKAVELNKEYLKQLNGIEIALDGQLSLYTEINKQVQDFGKGLTDNLKNSKLQGNTQLGLKGIYSSLNNLQGKLISNQEDLLRGELSSNDVAKDILKNRLLQQNQEKISNDLTSQKSNLENQLKAIIEEKNRSGKGYTEEQYKQKGEIAKQLQAVEALRKSLDSANEAQASITNELQNQLNNILAIEAKTGVAGKLLKGFTKIPILGDMLDIQGAQKAMNIAAANGASGFGTMLTGVKALGPSLKAALGPLGLILMAADAFKALVGAMFDADKQVTSLAKNLSISKDDAGDIRDYFITISNTIDTTYNRLQDVIDAQIQLSELSKFTILFSDTALENQIALTKEIGLSESEAANLNKTFSLNNAEGTKGTDIVYDQIAAFANENKMIANGKKILQEVSKVSGQILLNFRGNLPALTAAILQADKLGVSISEARDISNSLLDFESSISNELEASVFLGRRFNLEQARALALRKDYVGATEEVLKQVGSIEEFESMSAIHQQVIAKAAGMTVDKLADSLLYQKFIGTETGKTIDRFKAAGREDLANRLMTGKLQGEELKAAQSSLTAQEKFNIALDKAKEIFTNLVDGGTLDMLAGILKDIANYVAAITGTPIKAAETDILTNKATELQQNLAKTPTGIEKEVKIKELNDLKQTLTETSKGISDVEEGINILGDAAEWVFTNLITLGKGTSNIIGKSDKRLEDASKAAMQAKKTLDELNNPTIDKLNKEIQTLQLSQSKQNIKDGYSDSSDGPFEITNRYGQTAVTAVGDKIAVSPNMSFNRQPTQPTSVGISKEDVTVIVSNLLGEFNKGLNAITSRPSVAIIDGRDAFIRDTASNQNFGTYQGMNTSYLSA
jgi:hypothetical protein